MDQKQLEDRLLWIDIETTGTNPQKDAILEVETRITNQRATHTYEALHIVIDPTNYYLTTISPYIRDMHTRNHLLEETTTGFSQATAWRMLNAHLKHASKQATLHPAGSSPQFDINFLLPRIPNLPTYINHQYEDLTAIRRLLQIANPEALAMIMKNQTKTDHRTTHCLDKDIKQYQQMLDWVSSRS